MLPVLALLCLGVTAVAAKPVGDDVYDKHDYDISIEPPITVPSINLPNYLGRWYTMYDNLFVRSTYGRNTECGTADYGLNLNGTIAVENNARLGGPDSNKTTSISGYAYIPDPTEPGQLLVRFPTPGPPGEYWLIKIGPKEDTFPSTPLYQYAVITDSQRRALFVNSRDPEDFKERFEDEVLEFLEQNGFTKLSNRPIEKVQNSECR